MSPSLSWLWADFSQNEWSGCFAPAIRPLPFHLLQLFSSAVLAVNTLTKLPLSLPVLSSHRQSTTKYTHQVAQDRELMGEKPGSEKSMCVSWSSVCELYVQVCTWTCARSYICIFILNFYSQRKDSVFLILHLCWDSIVSLQTLMKARGWKTKLN